MKFFTILEGSDWLRARALDGIGRKALEKRMCWESDFRIPEDSGRKTALARELTGLLTLERSELLLWITGYGIWPSSENKDLFYAYRAWLGERRALHDAPCHVLQESDASALECLLDLILYFSWDATIIDDTGNAAVSLSHDEILSIQAKDESKGGRIEEMLRNLGLKRIG